MQEMLWRTGSVQQQQCQQPPLPVSIGDDLQNSRRTCSGTTWQRRAKGCSPQSSPSLSTAAVWDRKAYSSWQLGALRIGSACGCLLRSGPWWLQRWIFCCQFTLCAHEAADRGTLVQIHSVGHQVAKLEQEDLQAGGRKLAEPKRWNFQGGREDLKISGGTM